LRDFCIMAWLIGVALGFRQADPLAGFAITVLIVHIGIDATRDVVARLMDVHDDEVAGEVASLARAIPGVGGLGDLRVRWLGRQAEVRLVGLKELARMRPEQNCAGLPAQTPGLFPRRLQQRLLPAMHTVEVADR